MKRIHRLGKFYSKIMIKNIGIFVFVGLLMILFQDKGWFPNDNLYKIAQLVYDYVIPLMIVFEGARTCGGDEGGILGVIVLSGILVVAQGSHIFVALIIGPLLGFLWKWESGKLEQFVKKSRYLQSSSMLLKNMLITLTGIALAVLLFYGFSSVYRYGASFFSSTMYMVESRGVLCMVSIFIEPAKVFFLNNLVNHGIFIPIGIEEVSKVGKSVFFLLETNPGPGLGILLALFVRQKGKRSEYASVAFAQFVGGIHEVYFPFVLENMKLLIPLVSGSVAGTAYFLWVETGTTGAISPGSIVTVLALAGKTEVWKVLTGILLSCFISFTGGILILKRDRKDKGKEEMKIIPEKKGSYTKIGVICEGGMGSSAMGAAILRRLLSEKDMVEIEVKAYASDLVPVGIEILVCQKDYWERVQYRFSGKEVYLVGNLVNRTEYEALVEQLNRPK